MKIRYDDFQNGEYRELEAMMLALYAEDDDGEAMDPEKIKSTVEALDGYPDRGRILLFRLGDQDQEAPESPDRQETGQVPAIGYAILVYCWNSEYGGRFVIIDDLYIKPEYRNRGLATGFFDYLADFYQGKAAALMLEASPANTDAQRLYLRYGFHPAHSVHMMKRI